MSKKNKVEKTIEEKTVFDASNKIRQENIKEGLSEIYQDEDGEIVDVQKLSIRPKRRWWFWLLMSLLYLATLALIGYLVFYFINRSTDAEAVELTITSEKQLITGQEFYYVVKYQNLERVGINDVQIKMDYPENFIFLDASPQPTINNDIWKFDLLDSHRGGEIKIKGKILAPKGKQNIILGEIVYQPDNFTSEFKKVTSFENNIIDNGIHLEVVSPASAMVGDDQKIVIRYQSDDEGYLDNFRLIVEPTQVGNIKMLNQAQPDEITNSAPWEWQIEGIDKKERELIIRFSFLDKVVTSQSFNFKFEYRYDFDESLISDSDDAVIVDSDDSEDMEPVYYVFAEINQEIEVVKNDLNLNLIINGSDNNQNIDFDQTLNYSLNYSNKGQSDMENIVIMAILDGDLLDWSSLEDATGGVRRNNTITWDQEQVAQLSSLSPKETGVIDFSIKVKSADDLRSDGNYKGDKEIKSYVQFQIMADDTEEVADTHSNVSNMIINKINSDLQLIEQVKYFDDDNIAVGTGPLPPKVSETTSLRVYWDIDNTLHNLNNVQITSKLPAYVSWAGKDQTSIGKLRYDSNGHMIIWEINSLPINAQYPSAGFNISITPEISNQNQIMILLSGTKIVAQDSVTEDEISRVNPAKTTKLDDDVMIDNNGVVE